MSMQFFHARVGLNQIHHKAHWDMLSRTFVFASSGICGSRSAFQCVQSMTGAGFGGSSSPCSS
jgi:hypothetical protein